MNGAERAGRRCFLLLGIALWPASNAIAQEYPSAADALGARDYIGTDPSFSPEALDTPTPFGEDRVPVPGGWTVYPGLSIKEVFTDNLFLTADDERDDFVTVLTPRIDLSGNTRRATVRVNYALEGLLYANNGDENTHFHKLYSAGVYEVIKELVFLDGTATITQQSLTDTGSGVFTNFGPATFLGGEGDNINATGERTTVTTYRLSPYLTHRFGEWAETELRFEYDKVSDSAEDEAADEEQGNTDSTSQRYSAEIESGSRFTRLLWGVAFDRQDIDYDSGEDTTFQELLGNIGYIYSPHITLLGDVGYEKNDFASAGDPGSGIIWDVGFRWTPSGRTRLEATYGLRFFGDRYFVDLSHESRRTRWHISYDEEPYTPRQAQIDQTAAVPGGVFPIVDPETGLPTLSGAGVPSLSDEVYVDRRLSGGVVIEAGRNDFDILVFQEQRDFQLSGETDEFWGASILWTRSLNALTDLDMSVGWTSEDTSTDSSDERKDDLLGLHVGLRRELGRHLTSALEFRRVERSSTDPTEEFVENRISATIRLLF